MSLPSINFLHLTVSEIQPGQTFSLSLTVFEINNIFNFCQIQDGGQNLETTSMHTSPLTHKRHFIISHPVGRREIKISTAYLSNNDIVRHLCCEYVMKKMKLKGLPCKLHNKEPLTFSAHTHHHHIPSRTWMFQCDPILCPS